MCCCLHKALVAAILGLFPNSLPLQLSLQQIGTGNASCRAVEIWSHCTGCLMLKDEMVVTLLPAKMDKILARINC